MGATTSGNANQGLFKIDLSDKLDTLVSQSPIFCNKFFGAKETATEHKHQWLNDIVTPKRVPYASATSDGVFTFKTELDAGRFHVGDVVSIHGKPAVFEVTSVNGAAVTTRFLAANGAEVLSDGAFVAFNGTNTPTGAGVLCFDSHPYEEFSKEGILSFHQTGRNFNYTQILRGQVGLSRSFANYHTHGGENTIPKQLEFALTELARELNHIAIRGKRAEREFINGVETVKGRAGGLYDYGIEGGNVVNAAKGSETEPLTLKLLHDAAYQLLSQGGTPDVILCHPMQKRVISRIMDDKIIYQPNDKTRGGTVDRVYSDITGAPLEIITDFDVPEGDVWLMDSRCFGFATVGGGWLQAENTEQKMADGTIYRILGEFTLIFRNPAARLCRIKNLTPGDLVIA